MGNALYEAVIEVLSNIMIKSELILCSCCVKIKLLDGSVAGQISKKWFSIADDMVVKADSFGISCTLFKG